jgi:hypothetical protein
MIYLIYTWDYYPKLISCSLTKPFLKEGQFVKTVKLEGTMHINVYTREDALYTVTIDQSDLSDDIEINL